MSGLSFSVPANTGGSGHPTTQTSVFLQIPSAPSGNTCLFDYDLLSGHYYRLTLLSTRHLLLEFNLSPYGATVTADIGLVPISTWVWVSCGFATAGGLYLRGDVTPVGGTTTTTTALASSGSASGVTLTDLGFGCGQAVTSSHLGFPNDPTWTMSRLIQDQIAANDAAGNPRPIPTTDFTAGVAYREYLAHDPLGAALALSDSGTAALDMTAGVLGLTVLSAGPPLVSGAAAPTGSEGAIQIYTGGEWVSLPAGPVGATLRVGSSGLPEWQP